MLLELGLHKYSSLSPAQLDNVPLNKLMRLHKAYFRGWRNAQGGPMIDKAVAAATNVDKAVVRRTKHFGPRY